MTNKKVDYAHKITYVLFFPVKESIKNQYEYIGLTIRLELC